ncbi:hypothetical protein QBE52_14575 [Clostridiaceae bacterium 35-E11]
MREVLFSIILGVGAGIIDITPMILQKLDKYSIMSAFVQWVVLGIMITNTNIFGLESWLNGLVISVFLALPIIILVMKEDRKSAPIILVMSAFLGSLVGLIGQSIGI